MVQTEYSAVRNLEIRGFFVSRVKAFVALFLFVLLLTVLVVLAALLAHERGKENNARVKDDGTGLGKRNVYSPFYTRVESESRNDLPVTLT